MSGGLVRVVAGRELRERLHDRAMLVSTAVSLLVLSAVIALPALLGGDGPARADVAVADARSSALVQDAARTSADAFDVRLRVRRVDGEAAARAALTAGDADVAVVRGGAQLLSADDAPSGALPALQAASQRERQQAEPPPPLPVAVVGEDRSAERELAFVAVLLLYGQLLGFGFLLASGVAEEKGSRVVELLLAAVPARTLLAGKVLGLGLVALAQLVVLVLAAFGLGLATGRVELGDGAGGVIAVVLAWFVLGYALYACAFAAAGALVSRPEDVQSVTTPLVLIVLAVFFTAFGALAEPDGTLARVAALVPVSAPVIMPVRLIAGDAAAWEVVVAAALVVLSAAAIVALGARVYERSVLRTGGRVALRDALGRS